GSHTGRPWPRAPPAPPSRCVPASTARSGSLVRHRTWRPRHRWRLPQPGRPFQSASDGSASRTLYAGRGGIRAALLHGGVEKGHTSLRVGRWDSSRVDEGLIWAGVREVLHAVVADALSEREGRLLLLGSPAVPGEPRWLQVPARSEGLLERRGARVPRRAVRHRIDGQLARRVRVRERADTVTSHALGEPHRPPMSGGGAVAAAAAGAGGCARKARDDQGEHGKRGERPGCFTISSLPCVDWIDAVSMPWRAGHRYILGSCPGSAAHGHAGVIMGFRAQGRVARFAALDLAYP